MILNFQSCYTNLIIRIKQIADEAIDKCAVILNIRDRISEEQHKAANCRNEEDRAVHLKRLIEALTRYFYIIAFTEYLELLDPANPHQVTQ